MRSIYWNKLIFNEFVELAMLDEFEVELLKSHIRGDSIVKQSMDLKCSESTINRTISKLKAKYDEVSKQSDILPERYDVRQKKEIKDAMLKW